MGPVQVLVVRFAHPRFAGEALDELSRLRESGIVRLVDVMLIERSADGGFDTLAAPDEIASQLPLNSGAGSIAAAILGEPEQGSPTSPPPPMITDGPQWSLADAIPPGSMAAVALIEHVWATPLVAAIRRAGGRPVDEAWLAPHDVAVLEELLQRSRT